MAKAEEKKNQGVEKGEKDGSSATKSLMKERKASIKALKLDKKRMKVKLKKVTKILQCPPS